MAGVPVPMARVGQKRL